MLNEKNCMFLIIDIQDKLLKAVFNPQEISEKSSILASAAKTLEIPVVVTEQYPKGLGSTVDYLKNLLSAEYFEKTSFSALDEKIIKEKLKTLNKEHVIILGIETHICVYQTVQALMREGYKVTVAKEACSSRSEKEYTEAINNIRAMGIDVKTNEMILFELLKSSKHPKFKEIQALIK